LAGLLRAAVEFLPSFELEHQELISVHYWSATNIKLTIICLFVLAVCASHLITTGTTAAQTSDAEADAAAAFVIQLPKGLPVALWRQAIPADNPMTVEKIALGQALYFDKRLSSDGTLSCATCHDPATAFTDHSPLSIGVNGLTGTRSAPTVLNAMFGAAQFWDGRAQTLEEQAKQPLVNPVEMGMSSHAAVTLRVAAIPLYQQKFRRVFGSAGITIDTIVKAIAAFERTQLSGNSPFDRFIAGDKSALTGNQQRGWELFQHKAGCINCHSFSQSSPFFTDFKFHNTGIAMEEQNFAQLAARVRQTNAAGSRREQALNLVSHLPGFSELGRYLVTGQPQDSGAFKTPTLRDVELTTPYMHNGSEKTLLDVVRFYNRGGKSNQNLDERIIVLNLNDEEMSDLVEFLRALTSDDVLRQAQSVKPQNRLPVSLAISHHGK
jgi:cytochrome c peroxidase